MRRIPAAASLSPFSLFVAPAGSGTGQRSRTRVFERGACASGSPGLGSKDGQSLMEAREDKRGRQRLCGARGVELMAKPVVLVVEDNPMSRATAVEIFEDLGFAVFDAYNGRHALALLEARPEVSL